MDYQNKQLQAQQQATAISKRADVKSEAADKIPLPRQCANYNPNIWKYDFIQSLKSKYEEEGCKSRVDKLRSDVSRMFVEATDVLAKLVLIDRTIKLGLSTLFQEEIREALDAVASIQNDNLCVKEDLYAAALCFRLLKQHGYEISQDMFSCFMDETGAFSMTKCQDTNGIIELFETSHLALEGENILEEAKVFSVGALKDIHSTLDVELAKKVAHALELPLHWRVQWFEVRWHMKAYERDKNMNTALLDLTKLNFNRVQATLQDDIKQVYRWWKNLGLIENLKFSRDRLVESFMCSVGLVFESEYSSFRKYLTEAIIFILVIDDIYDIYGSLQELQQFTDAVVRWEYGKIEHLPECMKMAFQALHDTTNEMAYEIQKEKCWNGSVLSHLRKVWADFCKALFEEAKWYHNRYTPSLQEYLGNAWISSSGTVLAVHSFFSTMNDEATEEMSDFLEKNHDLLYNASLIIRLCNDLGTSAAELERGDVASSILCHMRELDVSEEIARTHIKRLISQSWTKMNGQCFTQSSLFQPFVNIIINFARVAHSLYQYGDGIGVQDRDTKKQILSLLIEPM